VPEFKPYSAFKAKGHDYFMSNADHLRAWLTLTLTPGLGGRTVDGLNEAFGSAAAWPDQSSAALTEAGLSERQINALRRPDAAALERCLAWLAHDQHHFISRDDALYPPLLLESGGAPAGLFVLGNPDYLLHPQLAVVGSRNASAGGLRHTHQLVEPLSRMGLVITSGLAEGIDGTAHRACLRAGGHTIAVAATGLDRVYPARHRDLARQISQQGALVSEFAPGTAAQRGHFPARNRIIAGMSLGTLVIEAGLRSGSLITARLAAEAGREVMAVPGSIDHPMARGCHQLIREGARLVACAEEVAEALTNLAGEQAERLRARLAQAQNNDLLDKSTAKPHLSQGHDEALDDEYQRLIDSMGYDPMPVDDIIRRSQLSASAVSSMLLRLELKGLVAAMPGAHYHLVGPASQPAQDA
jgi:DNA processing protein